MTAHRFTAAIVVAALLAACGEGGGKEGAPEASGPAAPPAKTVTPPPEPVPPPKPVPPTVAEWAAAARGTRDAKGRDWSHHMGDISFLFGTPAGLAKAAETGRPLMLFYTAMT